MKALDYISKTKEYLDYVERHILNVEKAWKIIKEKCKDMRFIYDDFFYFNLEQEIKYHDVSKLSEQEFVRYREAFYPTKDEYENRNGKRLDLGKAWEHHKDNNLHHWESWTKANLKLHPCEWEIHCAHMVVDWVAMSYEFGDTAEKFYNKNKEKIKIPKYAEDFIKEIFKRIYKD